MSLLSRLAGTTNVADRSQISFDDYLTLVGANGIGANLPNTTYGSNREPIGNNFLAYAAQGMQADAVVFACIATEMLHFSEARLQFQAMEGGRPGKLFGTAELSILEHPFQNGTTGELFARMSQDAALAGNFYAVRRGDYIKRLRPDRVTIVIGSVDGYGEPGELGTEVVGYIYAPDDSTEVFLPADEVCHYSPIPDPLASYRGMSWLTPVVREIEADKAATDHKAKFFENAATPNMVVKFDQRLTVDKVRAFKELLETEHRGSINAYKTLYLGGGADATVVGADMRQMDFKRIQGAGETRIAAAASIPPVVVGLSEGLEASTYSNYSQARRRYGDGTLRPKWRMAAASLEKLVNVPANARLAIDVRDVAFLLEDVKDRAEAARVQASTIRSLTDAGFDPNVVVDAVVSDDFAKLANGHTGLFSVQLQKPESKLSPTTTETKPTKAAE